MGAGKSKTARTLPRLSRRSERFNSPGTRLRTAETISLAGTPPLKSCDIAQVHADEFGECCPRRNMRRELPRPDLRGERLAHPRRVDDRRQLDGRQSRRDVAGEQLRVVDGAGVGPVPLRERPLTSRDGSSAPASDLGSLRRVSGDAGVTANVARVGDRTAAVWAAPQRQDGRLSGRTLPGSAPRGPLAGFDLAGLHDRLCGLGTG